MAWHIYVHVHLHNLIRVSSVSSASDSLQWIWYDTGQRSQQYIYISLASVNGQKELKYLPGIKTKGTKYRKDHNHMSIVKLAVIQVMTFADI